MKTLREAEQPFRNGDWGPKYLMRGPHCEWGVIVLKPGQAMGRHGHRQVVEDFYVLEGEPILSIGDRDFRARPGDVLRAEPPEGHDIRNDGAGPAKLVFIKAPCRPDDKLPGCVTASSRAVSPPGRG